VLPDEALCSRTPPFKPGRLRVPLDELEPGDWIPFRSLIGGGAFTIWVMPISPPWMRKGWVPLRGRRDEEGMLVSDDFSMSAVYGSRPASPRSMPGST
jgi:hypothetical protein